MFGFKIIKEIEYSDLIRKIQDLQKKNKQLNVLLNPPTGCTVVSKNYELEESKLELNSSECVNEAFCDRCVHYKHYIKYIDIYPFMKLIKYCDLKCECENFEDIKMGV